MNRESLNGAPRPAAWDAGTRRRFRQSLLRWFAKTARDLPWRRTRDPYAIWVSEIMLQQTQVATVIPYYERFLCRFPTLSDLAGAESDEVLRLWEGLGYYRRARQLHDAARRIVERHGGIFPESFDEVVGLPGIGRYTAGAILSIAHDQRLPILEANTIRLFSRLLRYTGDVRSAAAQARFWSFAEELLPRRGAGQFNQALMELGSTICQPRDPHCDACPARRLCPTREAGWQHRIPRRAERMRYEEVIEAAVVVFRDRRRREVLLRRGDEGRRWAGLWDFPRFRIDWSSNDAEGQLPSTVKDQLAEQAHRLTGVRATVLDHFATLRHGVTRFRITLECYLATAIPSGRHAMRDSVRWVPCHELERLPLNTTGRAICRRLGL